jgi:Flp pilus assembly secretin CpaC
MRMMASAQASWPVNKEVRMPSQTLNHARLFLLRFGVALIPVWAVLTQAPVAAAESATSITVKADQARLLALAGDPATVVVGNPLFADVSIKQGMIVIHGRHFGTTNVIALDKNGAHLADFELHVVRGGSQNVTVYKAGSTFSYLCAPNCESALQVGDNSDYYGSINSSVQQKLQLSTGASKLSE